MYELFLISGLRCTVYELFLAQGGAGLRLGSISIEKSLLALFPLVHQDDIFRYTLCTVYQLFKIPVPGFGSSKGFQRATVAYINYLVHNVYELIRYILVYGVPTFLFWVPNVRCPIFVRCAQTHRIGRSH